jgi:hypothetical protein
MPATCLGMQINDEVPVDKAHILVWDEAPELMLRK